MKVITRARRRAGRYFIRELRASLHGRWKKYWRLLDTNLDEDFRKAEAIRKSLLRLDVKNFLGNKFK